MGAAAPAPLAPRQLLVSTLAALGLALVVLLVAVLPAEHGYDPTGLGRATGFSRLYEGPEPHVEVVPEDAGLSPSLFALDARWTLAEVPVATQEGYLAELQGEARVELPFAMPNVSSVTARLEWRDDDVLDGQRTLPDFFEVSVRAPDGRRSQIVSGRNGADGEGNLSATLPWRTVPYPKVENGSLAISMEEDLSAVGNWTFVVRLYTAGGLENRSDVRDPGNAWRLSVTAEAWSLHVDRRADREGDRVRLTLPPGAGVEYKLLMEPGDSMRYAWTSSAPLYWDFHAERAGHDDEDFTRYAEGTSAREEGTLTASFAGRHGWFWQNRGTEAVTVTLQTSGEYRILGVV